MHIRAGNKQGSAIVEFMVVFPAFLFICLFVIEISLIWVDKHFLKIASFEAARSLITEEGNNPCDPNVAGSADNLTRAKRAATLKVAAISPSLSKLVAEAGLKIQMPQVLTRPDTNSTLFNAFMHLMVRLPSAYALTQVECTVLDDNSLKVNLTYWRSARMPFVRDAIWASYVLIFLNKKIAQSGLGGLVQFSLDDLYHNIQIDPKSVQANLPSTPFVKDAIKSALGGMAGMNLDFGKASEILSQLPQIDGFDMGYFDLSNRVSEFVNKPWEKNLLKDGLNSQSRVLTSIVYAMPEILRLIPLHAETRLTRFKVDNADDPWDDGYAFLIAPFNTKNIKGTSSDGGDHNWRHWALGMSQDFGHWHPQEDN